MRFINDIEFTKTLYGCIDGAIHFALADLAGQSHKLVFIARDDQRMMQMKSGLEIITPDIDIHMLPAWDCLPYDRVSADSALLSRRITCLSHFGRERHSQPSDRPQILLTTINSWLQKIPPPAFFSQTSIDIYAGQTIQQSDIAEILIRCGFYHTHTVREYGEFCVRGGLMDIFAVADHLPVRLDFFGDEIESMRYFDSLTQLSTKPVEGMLTLGTAKEYIADDKTVTRFCQNYVDAFGTVAMHDTLYKTVSSGQMVAGIEHWLPFLHDELVAPSSYFDAWPVLLDVDALPAAYARLAQIEDMYSARQEAVHTHTDEDVYRPVLPSTLFLTKQTIDHFQTDTHITEISTFSAPVQNKSTDHATQHLTIDTGAQPSPTFKIKGPAGADSLQAVATYIDTHTHKKMIVIAVSSKTAATRVGEMLTPYLKKPPQHVQSIPDMQTQNQVYIIVWPLDAGFETQKAVFFSEQDIFGAKITRPQTRKRADAYLREVSSLEVGDYVVHIDHGIGQYEGLQSIDSHGVTHECLFLRYADNHKLYLPVENIDLLSRYGQAGTDVILDRLGSSAWQSRKAKIKGKIKQMADTLIATAAKREMAVMEKLTPPTGLYDTFCTGFEHVETDDQLDCIADILDDLQSGKATDRLICGDVGFGKTEIALRAAFVATMAGYQVALVTPTTLLARQHGHVFESRFAEFPVNVAVLSRMIPPKQATQIKKEIQSGALQMIIGTHALLSKSLSFSNLGLLIIDEEQNFGVGQKERLKELKGQTHVMSLSATPIPRTLQLALSGVRQMSMITTPPIDRLAIRSFVGHWDKVILKEALQREKFRGGQSFVVTPRIADLPRLYDRIHALVPDMRILTAHGRMPSQTLDEVMSQFAEGGADILLSTNIIESGIDIANANTIIIHRANMFGLSQLYQLRGRVGRSRQRAYAYLTTDSQVVMTTNARRRLEVMQTLDKLGAGFSLASYDLDIRGAGNLLGEEQSGHVREVGAELYQELLRQAVAKIHKDRDQSAEGGEASLDGDETWSPQISLGVNIFIPNTYVQDLAVRLSLYRRIGTMTTSQDIEAMIDELKDRFGPLPVSVQNLMRVVTLKQLCKQLNINKIDAGRKGFVLSFRDNHFAQPEALITWITKKQSSVQLKSDHKLVVKDDMSQNDATIRTERIKACLEEMLTLL